jgi:hypothetical protein
MSNIVTNSWGQFIDNNFIPSEEIKKISNPYYSAWVNLCYYMANYVVDNHTSSLEVQTICLYNKQLGEWKLAIPHQQVSGGAVQNAKIDNVVDLVTGEVYLEHRFPKGFRHYGSAHSHGRIPPFFSSVDDASELGFPGFHATFGSIYLDKPQFEITASVVNNFKRYCIDANQYIEISKNGVSTYNTNINYHPTVLDQLIINVGSYSNLEDINNNALFSKYYQDLPDDYQYPTFKSNKQLIGGLSDAYSQQEKLEFNYFRTSLETQFMQALDSLSEPTEGLKERLLEEFIVEVAETENSGYDIDSMKEALLSFCNNTFSGLETDFSYRF